MSYIVDDTIAAIGSAPGGALRGIVRISGPQSLSCLNSCFRSRHGCHVAALRRPAVLSGTICLGQRLGKLNCDVYVWPTPRSFTRQPCAEIHTIGSPPLLDAVLRAICDAGARPAEPGEFTLRAFLAGRLDLTQVEAVLGVIEARNRADLDVALSQLAGGLATPLQRLRDELLDLLAHLEAGLDFVDEEIEFISASQLSKELEQLSREVERVTEQMACRSERVGEMRVVLFGWPNVGKSSLMNALSGQSASIVSEVAGTTRDYLSRRMRLNGLNCLLIDTAGTATDAPASRVDAAAQAMTKEQSRHADLQLFCLDSTRSLNSWERAELLRGSEATRLVVLTKVDLPRSTDFCDQAIQTSSKTGFGLGTLRRAVAHALATARQSPNACVDITAARCHQSLHSAAQALERARQVIEDQTGEELVATEIRVALDELGQIVGAVYTEDVLDRIFSRFCIGK